MLYYILKLNIQPTPTTMSRILVMAIHNANKLGTNLEGKKVFLFQKDLERLERMFGDMMEFGICAEIEMGNEEVMQGICNLVSCLDARRSEQYTLAFCNAIASKNRNYQNMVVKDLLSGLEKFPHMKTSGMQNLVREMMVLAKRARVA